MSEQLPELAPTGPNVHKGLRILASLSPKLNLADYQNAVPSLRELAIVNESAQMVRDLIVSASSEPAFFKPKRWRIDAIEPGQTSRLTNLDLQLDGPLLARLSESESAMVRLEVAGPEPGVDPAFALEAEVELLPRNHWGGISHLPEMVAAFVQPNDPVVDRLLKRAAQILREHGRDSALNGYQSGPKHAWEMLSALWSAVGAEAIDYALPPASFEQTGQKVRSPSQVLDGGIATCLDLALLFAALMEQAGLNPLVIFTTGHAFAGCWLRPEEFSTAAVDDPSALRKRLLLKELLLFETTLATGQPVTTFQRACEVGEKLLAEAAESAFEIAVDVRRARMRRIRPLAASEAPSLQTTAPVSPEQNPSQLLGEAPDLPDEFAPTPTEPDPRLLTPADRVARWQRKLLDLSLRNSLLNFRRNKRAVAFEAPDPGGLEDILANGRILKLMPRPELMDGSDARSLALHESRAQEDLRRRHALDALSKNELITKANQEDLEATLVELFRSSRTALEEGGANTLFLALGFLVWAPTGNEQKYRAPLILLPVTLNRRSARSGFTLTVHEDEPQFNPTLAEMLHQDFSLHLGIAEGELPKDDSGLDVDGIWARVAEAAKDIKGWEVVPEVVLSTFSFAKHLMWKDLVHRTDQLRLSPVVRHLIDTPKEPYFSGTDFVEPRELDRGYEPNEVFCPLPVDSSQLAVVMSAARNKDFVLIGPPGTGKSQTIANLIAHCIATDKRVLFVAEKIAALNVVHRRLQEQGLGEFCLELHSSKAKKTKVLETLGTAWSGRSAAPAGEWSAEASRLKRLRDSLNLYVERLHQPRPNGMTVYQAIGHAVAAHEAPQIDFEWADPSAHDAARMASFHNLIERLKVSSMAFGVSELARTPLLDIGQTEWTPLWQTDFLNSIRSLRTAAGALQERYGELAKQTGLPMDLALTGPQREAMLALVRELPQCLGSNWGFAVRTDTTELRGQLREAGALAAEYRSIAARVGKPWPAEVTSACTKGIALLTERQRLREELPMPWPSDIVIKLEEGAAGLARLREVERQLTVRYEYSGLAAAALADEWQRAGQALWPLSIMAKRRVREKLQRSVTGGAEANPETDLPVLTRVEQIRNELEFIDLRVLPAEVWSGVATKTEIVNAALQLRAALVLIRDGGLCASVAGMDLVASGLAGPMLKHTLDSVQKVAAVDNQLAELQWLEQATGGFWSLLQTRTHELAAAVGFYDEWRSGRIVSSHELVLAGRCGEHLREQLASLQRCWEVKRRIDALARLTESTDGMWRGVETNLDSLGRCLMFAETVARTLPLLAPTPIDEASARRGIAELCRSSAAASDFRAEILESACSALATAAARVVEAGRIAPPRHSFWATTGVHELEQRCEAMLGSGPRLRDWCFWTQAKSEASAAGLASLAAAIEESKVGPMTARRVFDTSYSRWWLDHVVSGDDVLRTFVSAEHERRIADFQVLDDRYAELTRDWIGAKLRASMPNMESRDITPEWGVLRHELTKKKRHLPLRELMGRLPSVVTTLTPCLLMSPLSIAQYLSLSAATFDLVVFDEASQITVWDAIGAIARAKQVVMVGDPKQLPPTNFFGRTDDETEQSDDVPDDMESILDECIGASLPTLQLNWHYRSRHESLITFSNRRFYGGNLITFPSPTTDDQAVSYHFAGGTYEKGATRTNPIEARAVVKDIADRLRSAGFRSSGFSIGVVTFNSEQQRLIEDLLDSERRRDPSIEPYFNEGQTEPVFVKNLESVQGDERDVMYFSLTYGPDAAGRVSMNFGPMNRDGGERRLNVAITRARRELRVFASLRPEQLDLSRTQARGVVELKHFMEFADRGPRAFAEFVTMGTGEFDSQFEQYVASALQSNGWRVHSQVGVSAFRIDLGVVHPDAPGVFLAGIECDGATYHRSATARDRDKLREQVLRGLGWRILRVWSTDWWLDRETTLRQLDTALRELLEQSRSQRDLGAAAAIGNPGNAVGDEPGTLQFADDASEPTDAPELTAGVDPVRFFEAAYDGVLGQLIGGIVESEGPILDESLARKVARLHGWQRTGGRILGRVTQLAAAAFRATQEEAGAFYWPSNRAAGQRVPFRHGMNRTADEICDLELVSLAAEVLESGKAGEDPIVAMARELGLQRLRALSRPRFERALREAQQTT